MRQFRFSKARRSSLTKGAPVHSRLRRMIAHRCGNIAAAPSTPDGVPAPIGLPLIGNGDWNDGMNHVGTEGRGESVWLAWFLLSILPRFAELADIRDIQLAATLPRTS